MFREDYILRMVKQLADAIARIAGLNQRGDHGEALEAADRAWGELLGDIPPDMASAIDSATLAGMLGRADRIRIGHGIAAEHARALAGQGDHAAAARRARRALELLLEARVIEARTGAAPSADSDAAALRALLAIVSRDALAPRYRELLPPEV
jgi:hypothetical protein